MSIAWSTFSWEAFATLTTGVLAVGAAWWVGFNQLQIQKRQAKLIENDLKIQLLEKRSVCVTKMADLHHAFMRHGKLAPQERHDLHQLLEQAVLLFPPRVSKMLDETVTAAYLVERHKERALNLGENQSEAHKMLQKSFEQEDIILKLMPQLLNELIDQTRVDAWE